MPTDFERRLALLRGATLPDEPEVRRPEGLPEPVIRRTTLALDARSEADVCDALGAWLSASGWEVFFEVPLGVGRPDVVGLRSDATLAIEAKLFDVGFIRGDVAKVRSSGVIKQGLRISRLVDYPYVALPQAAATVADAEFARLERRASARGLTLAMPGVLAVGRRVTQLRPPQGSPRDRVASAAVRRVALLYGAERGGVANSAQIERNLAMWADRVAGDGPAALAERYRLSTSAVRSILTRIERWREHLLVCPGSPCLALPTEAAWFAPAHRNAGQITGLSDLPALTANVRRS
jgi:hypothetical protein